MTVRRFSWEEARRYWENHAAVRAPAQVDEDTDWLQNVCYPGAPLWLNRHYARAQERAFEALLELVGRPRPGATALDVGCGTGRWTRRLLAAGYDVTGIDLQHLLIERNRRRHPQARFERCAIQDFQAVRPFELVTSVTVLQHNPFPEQERAAKRLADCIAPGGHLLLLENVRDQDAHVFSRSVAGWRSLFEQIGLRLRCLRRYDFAPLLRGYRSLAALVRSTAVDATPDPDRADTRAPLPGAVRRAHDGVTRVLGSADALLEPLLFRLRLGWPSVHAALLFRRDG